MKMGWTTRSGVGTPMAEWSVASFHGVFQEWEHVVQLRQRVDPSQQDERALGWDPRALAPQGAPRPGVRCHEAEAHNVPREGVEREPERSVHRLGFAVQRPMVIARLKKFWSVADLAVASGLSEADIAAFESGVSFPSSSAIGALERTLVTDICPLR
jgi:hypothetical protein